MTEHVKIYGVKPRIQYTADGTSTEYEFPFAIFSTSDIDVYFGDTLQESSTYTVSEARHSDGGSVTFETAPTSGTVITIVRSLSIERTSDFQEGSTLRAKVLNDELDYQIACTQQIAENLNRSMVLPPYATDSDVDLTLPTPSAGKAIVWNADGTNLENSTVEVNALENTIKGYKTAAEAAAATATTKAGIASDKADLASGKADLASDKADIAVQKATEAVSAAKELNGARTNCITEIPENIRLELSSGTLTLKAGSKVYVPNGAGVFNEITVAADLTCERQDSNDCMIFLNAASTTLQALPKSVCFSGSSAPVGNQFAYWFDTTNNKCKVTSDTGSTWAENNSLPVCIVSTDGSKISAIKQIFNGFGFVGASVFALPGVKGLIPNGRNEDGSLKNIPFTLTSVIISSDLFNNGDYAYAALTDELVLARSSFRLTRYDNQSNYIHRTDGLYKTSCLIATIHCDNNGIVLFHPKARFHALDWGDKDQIADVCLPDYSAGVDIATLSASSDGYEAPKDGEIVFLKCVGSSECTNTINGSTVLYKVSTGGGYSVAATFVVSAGDVFKTTAAANLAGSIYFFPFKGV